MKSLRRNIFLIAAMLISGGAYAEAATMRVDCRYHNNENLPGVNHCYASATYNAAGGAYSSVQLGVACDGDTIYNNSGRIQVETVSERISPTTAAFPAVEIFPGGPNGALSNNGTYESTLDFRVGRMDGTCYVQTISQ